MKNFEEISVDIRRDIFKTVCNNRAGHLASSLSSVEILVSLYFGNVLRYDPNNPTWEERDRFIMSKGHAALALYYILAKAGYYKKENINSFCMEGSIFGGLATYGKIPGIEMTSGSLGHGLSFAAGIAMASKLKAEPYQVYVMLGDGELQEGEVWEAALFISHNQLDNLTVIIDNNKIQATGSCDNIISLGDLTKKWTSFGFYVVETDGHNVEQLINNLTLKTNIPKVVIANTKKGKGLSFAEDKEFWHYKMPSEYEIEIGLKELGMNRKELTANEKQE